MRPSTARMHRPAAREPWRGTSRCCRCPRSSWPTAATSPLAINDVSIHRQQGKRVAHLEYDVNGDEVGRVRSDGIVVSTPAGSTGYNLANGGPVMAWGVHGYVVSFISPHSLTARTLVVAPSDRLAIVNRSEEEPVDVFVDGRPNGVLGPGERLEVEFAIDVAELAQVPGDFVLPAPAPEVRPARDAPLGVRDTAIPSAASGRPMSHAPRVTRREPAADGAGRAAARPGPQHPHRRDRRRQDAARPRARPAAGRQGPQRASSAPGRRRPTWRACSRCRLAWAGSDERLPDGAEELVLARRVSGPTGARAPTCAGARRPSPTCGARQASAVLLRPARAPQADAGDRAARCSSTRSAVRSSAAARERCARPTTRVRGSQRRLEPSCASWRARANASST